MAGLILETTFMVDLERELMAGTHGPAQTFLAAHADEELAVTFTVTGELAVGLAGSRARWEEYLAPFPVLECSADTCWQYGELYRYLRTNGLLIGSNDLWIAATALAHDRAVVTRNVREYQRVPGLRVMGY